MALFITFEGGEGSGKSSQARALYRRLVQSAVPALLTHEPGATRLGDRIARVLKWAQAIDISPVAELLLFNVSRAQLVAEVIRPALESGKVVVCDRFVDSTIAYQGYGRGLDLRMVKEVNDATVFGLRPDLTVLLDVLPEVGLTRKRKKKRDRFEQENLAFHQRIRAGYLELAAAEPERWLVVAANQPRDQIARIIWDRVSELLSRRKGKTVRL